MSWQSGNTTTAFLRYTRTMSIHPEGEDQSVEAVDTVHCPHCNSPVAIPEIIPVDDFACPECGQPVPIKMLAR